MSAPSLPTLIPVTPPPAEPVVRQTASASSSRDDGQRSFSATLDRTMDRQAPAATPDDRIAAKNDPAENQQNNNEEAPATVAVKPPQSDIEPSAPIGLPTDDQTSEAQLMVTQMAVATVLLPSALPLDGSGDAAQVVMNPALLPQENTVNPLVTDPAVAALVNQMAGDDANAMPQLTAGTPNANATSQAAASPLLSQVVGPMTSVQVALATETSATPVSTGTTASPAAAPTMDQPIALAPVQHQIQQNTVDIAVAAQSQTAQNAIATPAMAATAAHVVASVIDTPVAIDTSTGPAKPSLATATDTSGIAIAAPIDQSVIAPVAQANNSAANGQGPSTNVPNNTPITTTPRLQASALKLGDNDKKIVADRTAPDLKIQPTADKPFSEMMVQPTATHANAAQPLTAETGVAGATTLPANAMDKAVAQQVSRALVQNLPSGDKVLVVRLTPPELGTVRIELVERQGVLTARLHAEDDGVRLALERALPMMRQELRASDAPIREVSVSDQSLFDRAFADGRNHRSPDQGHSANRNRNDDEPSFSLDGGLRDRMSPTSATRSLGGRADLSGVDALA